MITKKRVPRRGIFIIPSALTTGNMFCGFYAITCIWAGTLDKASGHLDKAADNLDNAAIAIGIAIVLDALDGRIARLTSSTSQFGLQLDSLADAVSFGIAPALMLWGWELGAVKHLGWIACFLFMICGVMRLARFNIQKKELRKFIGLPIPAAAGFIAALAHFSVKYKEMSFFKSEIFPYFLVSLAIFLAISMISTVRYLSFKSLNLIRGKSQVNIVLIALFLAGIWFFSHEFLLLLMLAYIVSGIVGTARRKLFPRTVRAVTDEGNLDEPESSE